MKKFYFSNLFSYYLGLLLLPILLVVVFIFSSRQIIMHSYHISLNDKDFVSKVQSLNMDAKYLSNNEQTKTIKAGNDYLRLMYVQYENSKTAESDFKNEYKQDKQKAESINKDAVQRSYDGKNYNTRLINYLGGNYAYIRIDNTYLKIASRDPVLFEKTLGTLGYKDLLPKSTYALFVILTCIVVYATFAYLAIPYAYIFKKANINPLVAYVPICYKYFLCKLANEKGWKMIFLYIPIVSIIYRLILSLKLAKVFNKSELFGIGIFVLPVFIDPILAFDNSKYSFIDKSSSDNQKTNNKMPIIIFLICALILTAFITNKTLQCINKIEQEMNILEKESTSLAAYIQDVQNKIRQNWNPLKENSSKHVTVKFTVGKNGELENLTIAKSSDVKSVDEAALEAVRASAPFKPLPNHYKGESIPIEFTFDYNVRHKYIEVARK